MVFPSVLHSTDFDVSNFPLHFAQVVGDVLREFVTAQCGNQLSSEAISDEICENAEVNDPIW